MKIGVDIDAVLADMVPDLTEFYNRKKGTNFSHKDQDTYDLSIFWQCPEEVVFDVVEEFYESPEFEKIKPVSGAKGGIKQLARDHELFVITSRPESTQTRTNKWIKRHFPNRFQDVHFTSHFNRSGEIKTTKSKVCQSLGVELMIEDHLDFARDCASCGIKVLLLEYKWNQGRAQERFVRAVC